ncbi:MAG TPA: hypothetical protein VER33_22230 [Polyangiaceae bacterium]|nr:hypothetical protein [Polyangiaceae bacterium]
MCEAIDSTEPDLWVRFGHIIPPHVEGSIYILETGPESKDKLYRYISRDYVWGYDSHQASCRGNLTLLYIRNMFEESVVDGKPFGRKHLSEAIEKRFGIRTRASFQFTEQDRERFSQYCRTDSGLCDALYKVDRANQGHGLCFLAVAKCETLGRDRAEERLLATCRGLPTDMLACLQYTRTAAERIPCVDRVAAALCP